MTEILGIREIAYLSCGDARSYGAAPGSRTFPRGEIASDHFLEPFDFGAHEFVQARFDGGIERREAFTATENQPPRARLLEKVAGRVRLSLLEPVHELACLARNPGKLR